MMGKVINAIVSIIIILVVWTLFGDDMGIRYKVFVTIIALGNIFRISMGSQQEAYLTDIAKVREDINNGKLEVNKSNLDGMTRSSPHRA